MASLYKKGNKWWCRLKGDKVRGKWSGKPTPFAATDENKRNAKRYAERAQKNIDARNEAGKGAPQPDTVRGYASVTFIPKRRHEDLDWKNDESRLRLHVLPVIGNMKLTDVRAKHIAELVHRWRFETKLAQRTVYNVYSVVSALFRDAAIDGLIDATPCILTDDQLGPLVDSDPEWRDGSVFTRDEAETLISHPGIPFDRRLVYAFGLLAGMRPGEGAALRWRHWDPSVEPLSKLTVAKAYNTRKNREKSTKTNAVRRIPVHPTLAAMLAEWKLSGWAAMMGRPPTPDDLIVPLPPKAAARRRTRTGDAYRGHDYIGKRWREEDMKMLAGEGWRYREPYATKSTFITLVIDDGADRDIIRDRVTHTKPRKDAFDGYDRGPHWLETCAEVSKLKLRRLPPEAFAKGIVVPMAATARALATARATGKRSSSRKVVEAAGVEPASENASERTSTRVGTPLEVSRSPAAAGQRARRVS